MVPLPLADCSQRLGIHPKTLHHWLTQAHMPFVAHPTDARIKCLTEEQVQQLARLHGRPLQSPPSSALLNTVLALGSSEGQATSMPESEAVRLHPPPLPVSYPQEADLIQRLSSLETRVATLSEQLAQLALTLLQERDRTVEHRLTTLEAVIQQALGGSPLPHALPDPKGTEAGKERPAGLPHKRPLNPAEQRARSRMPPLIEYSAQGTYVIISAQEGELHLVPDSPEWFDWLATLSSFRFVGKQGRFTAYRESDRRGPKRGWTAHRSVHQRRYKHWLGVTDRLSTTSLEQIAGLLQSRFDSH